MLKLSNEACLAPNTTKNSKRVQVWREREHKCGVYWKRAPPLFLYKHGGWFGPSKLGNYPIPPQHATMQPPVEDGPEARHLGCACTQGAAAPWLARLAIAIARWVGGWAWAPPTSVFYLGKLRRWVSLLISLAHFCITLFELRPLLGFPLVFECVSRKTCFLQYKWNYVNSICICDIYLYSMHWY